MGIKRRSMFNRKFKTSRPERWELGRKLQGKSTENEVEEKEPVVVEEVQQTETKSEEPVVAEVETPKKKKTKKTKTTRKTRTKKD